ncbi:MAG: rhodanese-like domain-containing protein [Sideroxyarcus sp.]|nr:rhodanese-like domain-containing protein [Sideroxyarcus sp.]
MKKLLFVFALGLSVLWTAPAVLAASNEGAVDVKQGAAMQKQGALLLDVREQDEYAAVHAPGSTLIPLGQLSSRLGEIQQYKNKPVAVVCRSGGRSARGVEALRKAGFTQVVNIDGGMNAWESADLPVIKSH